LLGHGAPLVGVIEGQSGYCIPVKDAAWQAPRPLREVISYSTALSPLMARKARGGHDGSYISQEKIMGQTSTSTAIGNGPGNDSSGQSQQATGGSGGEQLTHDMKDTNTDQPVTKPAGNRQSAQEGSEGSAATASNRTAQDTRSRQAGSTGTGLGARETGGNQDEFDMPKE
jgi:hypothetical protein